MRRGALMSDLMRDMEISGFFHFFPRPSSTGRLRFLRFYPISGNSTNCLWVFVRARQIRSFYNSFSPLIVCRRVAQVPETRIRFPFAPACLCFKICYLLCSSNTSLDQLKRLDRLCLSLKHVNTSNFTQTRVCVILEPCPDLCRMY